MGNWESNNCQLKLQIILYESTVCKDKDKFVRVRSVVAHKRRLKAYLSVLMGGVAMVIRDSIILFDRGMVAIEISVLYNFIC
jgi:hypothetical protein